jgi:hypothetical protein
MFVDRRLGADAWWHADDTLRRAGVVRGWVFAPRQFLRYPKPSADAQPGNAAAIDRERGDIVLDRPVFRAMRGAGAWPLALSIDRRELANLVLPGGVLAQRLKLQPPASSDRVLHFVLSPLSECRLGNDGIETQAVDAATLAAPRIELERRQRQNRELQEYLRTQTVEAPSTPPAPVPSRPRAPRPATPAYGDRALAAIRSCGPVTTFDALKTHLGISGIFAENGLRSEISSLRNSGRIDYAGSLAPDTLVRLRRT